MRTFNQGDIIRHFKRDFLSEEEKKTNQYLYKVIDIAMYTETKEKMLVYQALYFPFETYVRPLEMSLEEVPKEKYPDASQIYRFEIYNREN